LIDFIIIGAQRCGTTSLYNYLIAHPNISSALNKEIHFFDINYNKGIDWYWKQFPLVSEKVNPDEKSVTGESTPYYLFHPLVAKRIFKHLPKIKLIVLLRNPVDRAYSHYNHAVRRGNESLSFEKAIKIEPERLREQEQKVLEGKNSLTYRRLSYLGRGAYAEQLEKYLELFQKKQFLILKSEDFFASPQQYLNKVFSFLGLSNFELKKFEKFGFGNNPPMNEKTRNFLTEYFRSHNERLSKLIGPDFSWK